MLFKQLLLAGALQAALTAAIDIDVNGTPGGRVDRFENNHPKGNRLNRTRTHNHDHDHDHVNVDVNHQHNSGPTTVNGNVQTRNANVDINVDSDGSRTEKFRNDHPKGNRFQDDDDDDSDDEDDVNVDVNHEGNTTTVGGNVQTRNVDVNVDTKEGSRTDRFLKNHPKGNRTHNDDFDSDSDNEDEDNVDLNVDHQHNGPTNVGGSIQTREYTHVTQYDDADNVQARNADTEAYYNEIAKFYNREVARDNVDVDVTAKPNSRLDNWLKAHPAGNRVHENTNVDVDVDHEHQDGETVVGGSVQARGTSTVVFANRCEKDIWIWSVDEGVRFRFLSNSIERRLTWIQGSSAPIKVAGRSKYTEPFRTPAAGGVVFKVSDTDQLVGGAHTQFEYAISNNQLYYDISFVDCAKGDSAASCPGHAQGLSIYSPDVCIFSHTIAAFSD